MIHFRKICIFMQFLSKSIPIQSYFSIILIEDLSAYDTNLIHKNCKKQFFALQNEYHLKFVRISSVIILVNDKL